MTEPPPLPVNKKSSIEIAALVLVAIVFLTISLLVQKPYAQGANIIRSVGTIIAAGLTLIMYSFLYRDNALFKIAENLYVGVTLGYTIIVYCWRQALRPEVFEPFYNAPTGGALVNELIHRGFPILLGILLLTRLSRQYGWLSRYSYALMVGWGAGFAIPVMTHSYILQQLNASVAPLQDAQATAANSEVFQGAWFAANPWFGQAVMIFGALSILIGTAAVLFYFFFSVEHKRAGGWVSKIGIWFLMVSFGASFGYTVMGRVSLLIGRVQFLLFDWLKLTK